MWWLMSNEITFVIIETDLKMTLQETIEVLQLPEYSNAAI